MSKPRDDEDMERHWREFHGDLSFRDPVEDFPEALERDAVAHFEVHVRNLLAHRLVLSPGDAELVVDQRAKEYDPLIGYQGSRIRIRTATGEHIITKEIFSLLNGVTPVEPPAIRATGILKAFRWFCGRDSREIVDLVLADVTRDIRDMSAEGRGIWFIRLAVWRNVFTTVLSVCWGAVHDLLKKIAKTVGLLGRLSR